MKWLKRVLLVLLVAFVAVQFIRPDRTNPPVDQTKVLRAPANVQTILDRSCRDCHSHETVWPWYSNVAPVSLFLADHIQEARKEVNLSEWGTYTPKKAAHKLEEMCEMVEKGEMPLQSYTLIHWKARLSDADRQTLCAWTKSERAGLLPVSR